jgi:hypothetical protein
MKRRKLFAIGVTLLAAGFLAAGSMVMMRTVQAEVGKKDAADAIKMATSRIDHVTVYQNNALVTREVDIPEGLGTMELVVSPLPPQTVDTSLYSEGSEGLRVLTTRFRLRPVKEDTREEVRKAEANLKELLESGQRMASDSKTLDDNLKMIGKLEGFTAANAVAATDKGKLDSDQITTLADYVMKQRTEKAKELVTLQQKIATNQEHIDFLRRQLRELSAGTSKVERDAIIIVDKANAAAGKIKLNYLVESVAWRPQYRFRAGKGENDQIRIEYLAGVVQQTGEEWNNVKLSLSTAQPMLNAAPPELGALAVALMPAGAPANPGFGQQGGPAPGYLGQFGNRAGGGRGGKGEQPKQPANAMELQEQLKMASEELRQEARDNFAKNRNKDAVRFLNESAAIDQSNEFLWAEKEDLVNRKRQRGPSEGQSVTYHLKNKLSVPSRNEEQVIEVTKLELKPEFCYMAVPVLTRHVYRQANLSNTTEYVLLPGEATMYNGDDFVGRMDVPLVAIGESFTAGFGVDPQLQVQREMMDKTRTQQGGNQVLKYDYRILVSSYKTKPVKVQLMERLPRSETETLNVTVLKSAPEVCEDALYVREKKPHNILRWDLKVEPGMNGEKAIPVSYSFKVEMDKNMMIGGFLSK